jgi:hypothetical protein
MTKSPARACFGYTRPMSQPIVPLSRVILNQLAARESRLLTLIVAVRRNLGRDEHIKGDLGEAVRSSLHKLVAARTVTEVDGMFSLAPTPPRGGFLRVSASAAPADKTVAMGEDW